MEINVTVQMQQTYKKRKWIKIYQLELKRISELICIKWLEKCLMESGLVRILQRNRIEYTTELQRDLLQVFTH